MSRVASLLTVKRKHTPTKVRVCSCVGIVPDLTTPQVHMHHNGGKSGSDKRTKVGFGSSELYGQIMALPSHYFQVFPGLVDLVGRYANSRVEVAHFEALVHATSLGPQ